MRFICQQIMITCNSEEIFSGKYFANTGVETHFLNGTEKFYQIYLFFQVELLHLNIFISIAVMETAGVERRSWFGVGLQMAYSTGYMLVPGYAYAIRDYQKLLMIPFAASALLTIMAFL